MGVFNKSSLIVILVITIIFLVIKLSYYHTLSTPWGSAPFSTSDQQRRSSEQQTSGLERYENNLLILYNRIPKTGSTSFMSVLYDLHVQNRINLAFVNVSSQSHRFTFLDQYKFAKNISFWNARKPAIYHGHFPFLDFTQFNLPQPMYINIIRKPLDRLVSHYYFLRYGDTFRPKKIRVHQGDKRTFDECVQQKGSACDSKKLWIQIPYFCGSDADCWKPGNKRALQKAKANVMNHYFLVGVTEEIEKFVELMERSVPRFFRSTLALFTKDGGVLIRKTKTKKPLKESTIKYFENTKVWQMENEFYNFVQNRFQNVYKIYLASKGRMQVSYVKVKP